MPEITSGGASYFWRAEGMGETPAHFIHCSLASSRVWLPLMAEFAPQLRSTAIDMPGHGGTDMPVEGVDLQVQAAEASIALIEQTGAPVHLIGHSYGATVALRVAYARPDLVRSLVMIEPVFYALLDDANDDAFARTIAVERLFGEYFEAGDLRAAARQFIGVWGGGVEWQKMPETQRQKMMDRIWFIPMQEDSIAKRNDTRMHLRDMAGIKVPTLLVRGADSPDVIASINNTLCAAMPNVRQEVVAGAGHMVPLTHHDIFADILRGFWGY